MERYRVEVGKRDGVRPGNIVGAVANEAGIDGDVIGPIQIHDSHSTIDLPEGMPSGIYQTLRKARVAGKQLQIAREGTSQNVATGGGEAGNKARHQGKTNQKRSTEPRFVKGKKSKTKQNGKRPKRSNPSA
jgi:ATP-dependent RNA helicase DeaD